MDENNTYDLFPYPSVAVAQTHPNRIGAIAALCGIAAARPERARVLELGCASGGNLIPMASQFPEAQFVGVDLSVQQVATGTSTISALGLTNITLHAMSIEAIQPDFGCFDYILCHGVYSWVPPAIQEKILAVCRENLAPHGVAYVSYNVYPGWHMRGAIRDMMLHHVRTTTEPRARVAQARALLDFLVAQVSEHSAYGAMLRDELKRLAASPDAYLFHEHLEAYNSPLYFHEFVARATAAGLSYVSDTDLKTMNEQSLRPEATTMLRHLAGNLVDQQQYVDFLYNRMFRQSLLTPRHTTPRWRFEPEDIADLWIAGRFAIEPGKTDTTQCTGDDGLTWNVKPGPLLATLRRLNDAYPQSVQVGDLVGGAIGETGIPAGVASAQVQPVVASLTRSLGQMALRGSLSLGLSPWPLVTSVADCPVASVVVRWQAATGQAITSQTHALVNPDAGVRRLLTELDGTRDIVSLARLFDVPTATMLAALQKVADSGLLAG